jgi:hypothetical protein
MKTLGYILVVLFVTGCATSTGWRFEIGVSPVKSLDNRVGLAQLNHQGAIEPKTRYAKE